MIMYRVSQKKVCFRNFQHSGPGPESLGLLGHSWNSGPMRTFRAILGYFGHSAPSWAGLFWAILGILGLLDHPGPIWAFWAILGLLGHSGHSRPFWAFCAFRAILGFFSPMHIDI